MSNKVYWTISGFAYIAAITAINNLMPDAAWYWQVLMLVGSLLLCTITFSVAYELYALLRLRRIRQESMVRIQNRVAETMERIVKMPEN